MIDATLRAVVREEVQRALAEEKAQKALAAEALQESLRELVRQSIAAATPGIVRAAHDYSILRTASGVGRMVARANRVAGA